MTTPNLRCMRKRYDPGLAFLSVDQPCGKPATHYSSWTEMLDQPRRWTGDPPDSLGTLLCPSCAQWWRHVFLPEGASKPTTIVQAVRNFVGAWALARHSEKRRSLAAVLDWLQPDWRERRAHRRFPSLRSRLLIRRSA